MRKLLSTFWRGIGPQVAIFGALVVLSGCGQSPTASVKKLFQPSPDKDVTTDPGYKFAPFVGTVWKTRTNIALVDIARYTGARDLKLLPPIYFDKTRPDYTPVHDMKIIEVLTPGSRLRITRLMKDQGAWGGLQVEAVLLDGTNAQKAVIVHGSLLGGDDSSGGSTASKGWRLNSILFEKQ